MASRFECTAPTQPSTTTAAAAAAASNKNTMARSIQLLPAAALAALCCLALAGVALASSKFTVEGRVYCDTCRAGFETSLSSYIKGAKVKLECVHFESGELEHLAEGVTDGTGTFRLEVAKSHDEDICEVVLVESPEKDCSEISTERSRARIVLSNDSGIASNVRYANSLGFLRNEPLSDCGLLLQMYALGTDEF